MDRSAAKNVRVGHLSSNREIWRCQKLFHQSIELLVSSAMKTSPAYFQTGRPLCAVSLAPSSFPNQLFFRPFLFSFVSTVFFILLGALRWSFEPTGPSTSLTVDVAAVHMLCPSSARVVSSTIELKIFRCFVHFDNLGFNCTTILANNLLIQYITNISTLPKGFAASHALLSRVNFPSPLKSMYAIAA